MKLKCVLRDCFHLSETVFTAQYIFEQKGNEKYKGKYSEAVQSVRVEVNLRDNNDSVFNKFVEGQEYEFDVVKKEKVELAY